MTHMLRAASLLVWTLVATLPFSSAQNCPFAGPAYLHTSSPLAAPRAAEAFDAAITQAFADGTLNVSKTFFGIDVYSVLGSGKEAKDAALYSRFHTATAGSNKTAVTVGPDTVFRVFSISKLITVYAFLAKLGDKYWHEPVTKYVPELAAAAAKRNSWGVGRGGFDWDEVTLGSLAGQISGIGKDYALNDLSVIQPGGAPGIRRITDNEIVRCGSIGLSPCPRKRAMEMVLRQFPFSLSERTPSYSNVAFQLLAYAAEKIAGMSFPAIIKSQLIDPLRLTRTYLTNPGNNFSDAVIIDPWDADLGDENPTAGYYLSTTDVSKLGRSILTSSLLPARTTRAWLQATAHTSHVRASMGRPWEILRRDVPVSAGSKTTRVVDVFTKQGGGAAYTSLIAVVPDYGVGFSLLTAGPQAGDAYLIKKLWLDIYLPALEEASREQVAANFAGTYTLSDNSSATLKLLPNEPGLYVSEMYSGGVDFITLMASIWASQGGEVGEGWSAFLYPMGLVEGNKVAFRAVWETPGKPVGEDCPVWAEEDRIRFGGYPGDLFIFHLGEGGRVTGLEVPITGRTLLRD